MPVHEGKIIFVDNEALFPLKLDRQPILQWKSDHPNHIAINKSDYTIKITLERKAPRMGEVREAKYIVPAGLSVLTQNQKTVTYKPGDEQILG